MRISVNGIALHVRMADAAEDRLTMVLLHGGPGADHTLFLPEAEILAAQARLVYVDQRGSGRSDRGEPEQWTWDQWADDIAGLCAVLGIAKPVLLGTSSGAVVAMACAARHPGLVAGLVLDSPLGVPATLAQTLEVFERRGGPDARRAAERYLQGDTSDEAAQDWQRYALPLYTTAGQADMKQRMALARINDDVQAHFRRGGCGDPEAYEPDVPTLVLVGEDDPVVPTAAARALAERRGARIEVVEGIGHGVLRQAPHRARLAIAEFLPRTAAAPGAGHATTDAAAARPV